MAVMPGSIEQLNGPYNKGNNNQRTNPAQPEAPIYLYTISSGQEGIQTRAVLHTKSLTTTYLPKYPSSGLALGSWVVTLCNSSIMRRSTLTQRVGDTHFLGKVMYFF